MLLGPAVSHANPCRTIPCPDREAVFVDLRRARQTPSGVVVGISSIGRTERSGCPP